MGHPQLGQCLFQVVEHHGHRPVLSNVLPAALPGEGIDVGGLRLRLRFRLGLRGQDGDGGLLRDLGRLLLGGAGTERSRQRGGQQESGETGFYGHCDSSLLVWGASIQRREIPPSADGGLLCPRRQSNQNAAGVCSEAHRSGAPSRCTPDPITGDAYLQGEAEFPARKI